MKNRYHIMYNQPRAHTVGNVEYINEEWVFFDEETDEAFALAEVVHDDFEILYHNHWLPARFYEEHLVKIENQIHPLQDGEMIRVRKKLQYVYNEWLQELRDNALEMFAEALAKWEYSLYDSIYCHNSLFFQVGPGPREGVNFIIYDNSEMVCALQHQYIRSGTEQKDIFLLTKANGMTLTMTI
ncbi:DUF2777 family protein [Ectobacillus antri]|jgi:hypothetical protein|uniref:DUF2777 family protein n=1 Tax=Ectobacillus antri TaxID=2486280 RepID=A0ABT6H6B4_9BACI|nr:DUF2777 family protein [Ectobacillus antri]MDG4656701.1 DUF2777 family protein [Ectobacillus antri]MDG5753936.1 DUF2777 family protein [Ectobacillus antri]